MQNRAVDSPCGDRRFYVVWMLAYGFQAASAVCWCMWADQFVGSKQTHIAVLATCMTAVTSVVIIAGGTLWCTIEGSVKHQAAHLRHEKCIGDRPRCDEIVQTGELLFYIVWVWAFVLVAFCNLKYLRKISSRLPQTPLLFVCMWRDRQITRTTLMLVLHALNLWVTFVRG